MLDIKFIRENSELVKKNTKNRLGDPTVVDKLIEVDEKRRKLIQESDSMLEKRNSLSKSKPSPEQIEEVKFINSKIKELEPEMKKIDEDFRSLILKIPNLTHKDVFVSEDEDDNPILEIVGKPTEFSFNPKDHVEISESCDLIDFDRATKISGTKFYFLKNELAIMEFALIQYALSIATNEGFIPFTTPDLAKVEVLEGLGFQPRGESTQIYNIEGSDLCLIGTAEITLGGYHSGELLEEKELPKKYVAVSHCFRTEAGAYSKFAKGIFRVHQFTKIEMFVYCTEEKAEELHKEILGIEKNIFSGLGIPFRVIDHCTADLGGPSIRTYDLEAWMPGKPSKKEGIMGDWAEITSTSNCTDYQSRGLNIKYKTNLGEKKFVYTLNGTAIAITRAMIAILENYQQADGSVIIPEVLRPYMGGIEVIKPRK